MEMFTNTLLKREWVLVDFIWQNYKQLETFRDCKTMVFCSKWFPSIQTPNIAFVPFVSLCKHFAIGWWWLLKTIAKHRQEKIVFICVQDKWINNIFCRNIKNKMLSLLRPLNNSPAIVLSIKIQFPTGNFLHIINLYNWICESELFKWQKNQLSFN